MAILSIFDVHSSPFLTVNTKGTYEMAIFFFQTWFMKRPSNIEEDALVDGETSAEEDDDGLIENRPS